MKRMITFCSIFILCLSTLFSTTAFCDYDGEISSCNAISESVVQPYAEETEWVYRIHNGYYEKRLWSITYGKWLTDWIVIRPVD